MSQFQNWVRGLPQSIPPRVELLPLSNISIAKGEICFTDDAGFIIVATEAAGDEGRPFFVAIEAVDNSGGSAGDLKVPVVGQGQQVTVQTKSILEPGDPVKISSTAGMVTLYVVGVSADPHGERVGRFIGIEPGKYLKDVADPFAESFITDFTSVNAAVDDVVIIELE